MGSNLELEEEFVEQGTAEETTHDKKPLKSQVVDKLAAICFLLGSLLFTVDGIGYCIEQLTWHGLCYTLGSALFALGGGFMLI